MPLIIGIRTRGKLDTWLPPIVVNKDKAERGDCQLSVIIDSLLPLAIQCECECMRETSPFPMRGRKRGGYKTRIQREAKELPRRMFFLREIAERRRGNVVNTLSI